MTRATNFFYKMFTTKLINILKKKKKKLNKCLRLRIYLSHTQFDIHLQFDITNFNLIFLRKKFQFAYFILRFNQS